MSLKYEIIDVENAKKDLICWEFENLDQVIEKVEKENPISKFYCLETMQGNNMMLYFENLDKINESFRVLITKLER